MLDEFAGLVAARTDVGAAFRAWKKLQSELDAFHMDEREKAARLDLLKFQMGEIASAKLRAGEDEELETTRRVLSSADKLQRLCADAYAALYDSDAAALAQLGIVWKRVADLADVDPAFRPHVEARDAIKPQLEDLAQMLRAYGEHIDASPERLQQVEDRLALVDRLKRKYGPSLADVIAKREALSRQLDALEHADERRAGLEGETRAARERFLDGARALSRKRREAAKQFATRIQSLLAELAMGRTQFDFRFDAEPPESAWAETGVDVAECYISANVGEDLRPLARIASGGELSRIMLAIRTLAAAGAPGKTLIFDEIDAGIGGRVADVVGKKLRAIGASFQVLCITHLPQIAAAGHTHFHISKRVVNGRTHTEVVRLDESQRVEELARMIGGAAPTDAARAAARELLGESEAKTKAKASEAKAKRHRRERASENRARGGCSASGSEPRKLSMKYFIETYGCQMNVHDSERIAGLLEQAGYDATSEPRDADVVVINTCSVRERAEEKLYTRLGEIRQASNETGRMPVVAVTGCVAQQEGVAMSKRSNLIDVIVGTQSLKQLPALVGQAMAADSDEQSAPLIDVNAYEDVSFPLGLARRQDPVKAYVTIIEGCNEFCSFCVVPYTRGHERMRPRRDILDEVIRAADEGHREIQLLGQIVNHYQAPDDAACDFAALLEAVHEVPGVERVRFASPHPRHVPMRLIEAVRDLPKVCKHFHLPVQSGSTRVLEAMRRRYTRESYLELVALLRDMVPGITLTTDMIVGFPGETEADFDDTMSLTRAVRYESMYSFKYSPRPNTLAQKRYPDDVSEQEKTRRIVALQALQREIQIELHEAEVGSTVDVLIDSVSRRREWELSGRTFGNTVVNVPGPREWLGRTVAVRIARAGAYSLAGNALQLDTACIEA